MAEHPVILDNKKQVKILVRQPGQPQTHKEAVVNEAPAVADPKKTVAQKLSAYAFGEEVAQPGKYILDAYLKPTGQRVANDMVERLLMTIKHMFQRWIFGLNAKLPDDKWGGDRTSFSNISRRNEPIKAMVMMSPVKELTFATQADAERVRADLMETAKEENGVVTVRQYYESSGRPELVEANGVSSSSGWKEEMIKKIEVKAQPDGSGYYLTMPKPISLTAN